MGTTAIGSEESPTSLHMTFFRADGRSRLQTNPDTCTELRQVWKNFALERVKNVEHEFLLGDVVDSVSELT